MGEFLRFGTIGAVNTATYYVLFRLAHLVLPYLAAHFLAFFASITSSFFLNCRFTFHVRPTWPRYLRFPLANLSTLVIMTLGVGTLVEVVGLAPDVASLVVALAAVPITFLVSRLLLVGRLGAHAPGRHGARRAG